MKSSDSEILWHYTSLSGFVGIMESRELWASDVRFLNDFGEVRDARNALSDSCELLEERFSGSRLIKSATQVAMDVSDREFTVFAACFSRRGDDLSQWRGYSKSQVGISMGFKRGALVGHNKLKLCPVLYGDETADAFERVFDTYLNRHAAICDTDPDSWRRGLARELMGICARSKAEAWREEQEERLVAFTHGLTKRPKYRIGESHLIAHLSLTLDTLLPGSLSSVVVGPHPDNYITQQTVTEFLSRMFSTSSRIRVERSSTKLR